MPLLFGKLYFPEIAYELKSQLQHFS